MVVFVTARQRSFGKVMFSQVSICSQGGELGTSSWDRSHGRVHPPPPTHQTLGPDGNRNTCGRQAGGTHPTGMLSCCFIFCDIQVFPGKHFVAEPFKHIFVNRKCSFLRKKNSFVTSRLQRNLIHKNLLVIGGTHCNHTF